MSVNWHYFKQIQNRSAKSNRVAALGKPTHVSTAKDMEEFTGYSQDQRQQTRTGRAWRAEELRLKSSEDLHKLWYVMLKEKNKLKSDYLMCRQMQQVFYGYNDLKKVRLGMARTLTIVNERKKLRSLYREHLENEYIAQKKAEEHKQLMEDREKLKKQGKPFPLLPHELRKAAKLRDQRNTERLLKAKQDIMDSVKEDESQMAPTMTEGDVEFLATTQVKLGQRDIIKMYVGNWASLDLKQRRKIMSYVQAQRSKHAKEIFLKELSALGRKLEQESADANIPDARVKGKKDPLKLKLEAITA